MILNTVVCLQNIFCNIYKKSFLKWGGAYYQHESFLKQADEQTF